MGILSKSAIALSIVATLATIGTASAAAADTPAVDFDYSISGLQAGSNMEVQYDAGVATSYGGTATINRGAISAVWFETNGLLLAASDSTDPVSADLSQYLHVGSGAVTGNATLPAGVSVSVTNASTHQTFTLKGGSFSIPTGVGLLGARPPASGSQTISCRGTVRSCKAQVSIAGGASNREVTIRLPGRKLRLRSVKAVPARCRGTYLLSDGHSLDRGSEYRVDLNALRSDPRGSHLLLTFAA